MYFFFLGKSAAWLVALAQKGCRRDNGGEVPS